MSWGLRQTLIVSVSVMDAGREGSLQKGGVSLPLLLLGIPLLEVTRICPLVKRVGELFINAETSHISSSYSHLRIIPAGRGEFVQDCKAV